VTELERDAMSCQQVLLCLTYVVFTFHARREEYSDLLSDNFTSLSSCHFCGILGKNWAAIFLLIFASLWLHGIIDILSAWHHKHMPEGECKFFLSLALVGFSQFMSSLRFMVD